MRGIVAAICLAFSLSAHASTNSSEISDLWYAPGEDGWGLNIVLQNNVAFATFYVYDTSRNPVWFTAVLGYSAGPVFSGNLFADRGPWYGGPYTPPSTERQAGTATFTLNDLYHATLTYTVDGVTVTKALQRLTWTYENLTGVYIMGTSTRATNCNPVSLNGLSESTDELLVSQIGTTVAMRTLTDGCLYNGTYSQNGKLGAVSGNYSCPDGETGTFSILELTPTVNGFTGRISGANQFCQFSGYIGGIVRAQ